MKRVSFLKNVAVITLGSLIAKGVGAIYRIPLTNALGGYGMGLYQMAYPLFVLLLTFSSAGIPAAISRSVAAWRERGDSSDMVASALKTFALIGGMGALLMVLLAPAMGRLQGEENLLFCYIALAPSVFLVSLIAVLRGYFQGMGNMLPTAVSEIVEQLVKAGAGLYFAFRFQSEPHKAVAYTLFAVTLSEFAALGYLALRYRRSRGRAFGLSRKRFAALSARRVSGSAVFFSALPTMVSVSLLPVSQFFDSVIIVRQLSTYTSRAVSLYGLFSGGALALINLPATLAYGFAAASVPAVSQAAARGEWERAREGAITALVFTLALSVPAAIGIFAFGKPVVSLLYPSLGAADAATLVKLMRYSALSAVTLSGVQTLSACLTGLGRAGWAAFSMGIAVALKLSLEFILVKNPAYSVFGAAISLDACYLVAFFLELFYTLRKSKEEKAGDYDNRRGRREGGFNEAGGGENPCGGTRCLAYGENALGREREGTRRSLPHARRTLRKEP